MKKTTAVSFRDVDITGGFWKEKQTLISETTIYAVMNRFEDTGRFEAFNLSWKEGSDIPKPHYFWDSDIAKWMESAAYIYEKNHDENLKRITLDVVAKIEKHQLPDGYFNIYHQIVEPENRFKNREHHELYCLGHLIEAAVAISTCMGDDKLIEVLDRYIDLVIKTFMVDCSADFTTPGHEEIELALFRLYTLRGDKKYYDLAMFFLNKRGEKEEFSWDWEKRGYNQSHMPVREQKDAVGHSVRACYLYTAMADAAVLAGDEKMLAACNALFEDIAERKMYISGGIGSTNKGEAFTIGYDLPSDSAYTESCAGIALAFFANRMKDIEPDAKYSDVIERLMYNGILSSLSLDGKSFFYENPLEINLVDRNRYTSTHDRCELPRTQRSEVFDCSCCPPNITRFYASLGDYVLSFSDEAVYLHQYMPMKAEADGAVISVETLYPRDGKISINAKSLSGRMLAVRKPFWCDSFTSSVSPVKEEKGYLFFAATEDETALEIDFKMEPVFIASNSHLRHTAGKTALMYGPMLYCIERQDNNDWELWNLIPDTTKELQRKFDEKIGAFRFGAAGKLLRPGSSLYNRISDMKLTDVIIQFIPYYSFANRGEDDMRVWLG